MILLSIPSPSSGAIHIGPFQLRAYGLMIALGVLAGVWLAGRRLEAKGVGTREDMAAIALWAVPAGVIGARLYHVITDWQRFEDAPLDAFKIWEGGLGIPGGMLLGVIVGVWVGHRRGIPLSPGLAAVVPALPLAQAIGRWGNWWNQELFGRPTDLPWGLEVSDQAAAAAGYPPGTTFHPTFLYESLWNFGLCGFLIWVDRRYRPRGYQMVALYVLGYAVGRLWVEMLRIDPANEIGGFRVNEVVSVVAIVLAAGALVFGPRLGWGRAGDPDAGEAIVVPGAVGGAAGVGGTSGDGGPSVEDDGAGDDGREDVGREDVGREDVGREDVGREDVGREDVGREYLGGASVDGDAEGAGDNEPGGPEPAEEQAGSADGTAPDSGG